MIRILMWICLALLLAPVALAQADHERVLTVVKGTPARDLDSTLPKMRFERWLLDVVGKDVELRWELNDCGESDDTNAGAPKQDTPICAAVEAQLDPGRGFFILITIGTEKKGIGGKPKLHSIIVQANRRMRKLPRLRDLPAALRPSEQ